VAHLRAARMIGCHLPPWRPRLILPCVRWLVWSAGSLAFFLNPWLACGIDPSDDFHYGDVEMRAAVVGTWNVAMILTSGEEPSITIGLEQSSAAQALKSAESAGRPTRSLVRSAAACGQRTLIKNAAACVSSSLMPLAGTFVAGDSAYAASPVSGELMVYGLQFVTGQFSVSLGDSMRITAQLSNDGLASGGILSSMSGQTLGTATLARVTP
jgi:hypothetical protein